MKTSFLMPFILMTAFTPNFASAQNADDIIFNQYLPQYNYAGGSFLINAGVSQNHNQERAFLIWADDLRQSSSDRYLGLGEYGPTLNFLTQQGTTSEPSGSLRNMLPKKIIKSKFANVYYLLGYVTNSSHTINNHKVYSSPTLYKIDGNTLIPIWEKRINLAVLSTTNEKTVIEYNDMIETNDMGIVLVGKYADNTLTKESVFATKINSSGDLVWRYRYNNTGNQCNEGANSVAETTDGRLSLTGYITKCTSGSIPYNTDVLYLETLANGTLVAGTSWRFPRPANLSIWADKITCYTATPGNDRLIISGYVDTLDVTGAKNRQILVMNLRQNGGLITVNHIGDPKADVCNDLIFSKMSTRNDYLIYLTGQTDNYKHKSGVGDAYFMYAKFNAVTGVDVDALREFSIFPVTLSPYDDTYINRTGLEIKNAGKYTKFAILATGKYQPPAASEQTYTNVLLRDFADEISCIVKKHPPIGRLHPVPVPLSITPDAPAIFPYKEFDWTKLHALAVTKFCQNISIDPTHAQNLITADNHSFPSLQVLRASPNPAQSVINITTADGSLLSGKYKNAQVRIYNTAMQAEKIVTITPMQRTSMQLPVAQLKAGVYMVQLIRGNETVSCVFIKE